MALSYSITLRVPKSYTLTALDLTNLWEFDAGATSGLTSIDDLLNEAKTIYELAHGGTFSWVESEDATYNYYTVSWSGLSSDPANEATGNPVALYYIDSITGEEGSAQFVYAAICNCPPSINPEDAEDCLTCYSQSIAFCDSEIVVEGLTGDTEYSFDIVDQATGKHYTYTATTDSFGAADLLTADFPTGLFTPFNGAFTITITDEDGNPVTLTYGYVNYSCIELTVNTQTDYTP